MEYSSKNTGTSSSKEKKREESCINDGFHLQDQNKKRLSMKQNRNPSQDNKFS